MLGKDSQDKLASVVSDPNDERNATITFSPIPGEFDGVEVGEIFILPPTKPIARGGLMYRINSLTRSGDTLTIEGRQPPLSDLIKDGEIGTDHTLTAADIDMEATMADMLPGPPAIMAGLGPRPTTSFTINWPRIDFRDDYFLCDGSMPCSVVGHITLPDPQFNIQMAFDWMGVTRSQFRVNVDAEVAIEITGQLSAPGVGKTVRLFTIHFAPIWLGPYCVIDPRLTIRLGLRATFAFNVLSTGFSGGAHLQAGNEWVRGVGNRDLSSATATGTAHAEGMSQTTLLADVYSRAEFGFFFYYVSGPIVYFEQGPRVDVATPRHPFVQVGYHVGTGLGGRFDIIDETLLSLISVTVEVFGFTRYFWESSNSNPAISLYAPSSYTAVQPNDLVAFSVTAYDVEDGPTLPAQATWSSDLDGPLGTGTTLSHRFFAGGPGTRTVTLTVRDTDGGTDQRTVGINLPAANPTITLLDPTPAPAQHYTGTPLTVTAQVTSPYWPANDVCTASGWTLYWSSSNPSDSFNAAANSGCTGTVTLGSVGNRDLTFTATDRWGQTSSQLVKVTAVAAPSCSVTIAASPTTELTNTGGVTTVNLSANVAALCLPGYDYFVVSSTVNGGYHEKIFPNGITATFNPTTDLADDGFLMIKQFDTSLQTLDVTFVHSWDNGVGDVGAVSPPSPLHLHYQWQ